MLGIFKRGKYQHPLKQKKRQTHINSISAYSKKKQTVAKSRLQVMQALAEIGEPAHYRMISNHLKVIEGSVTPRLKELRDKELIKVAIVKHGFNRVKVNYYTLTQKGWRYLNDRTTDE